MTRDYYHPWWRYLFPELRRLRNFVLRRPVMISKRRSKLLKIMGVISAFAVSIQWFLFVAAMGARLWLQALLWLLCSSPYLAVVILSRPQDGEPQAEPEEEHDDDELEPDGQWVRSTAGCWVYE